MNIRDFFLTEQTGSAHSYLFYGRSCPSLFFSIFLPRFAARNGLQFSALPADGLQLEHRCYQGFLGSPSLFWCGEFGSLAAASKKSLTALLGAGYAGPHGLAFFCSSKERTARMAQGMVDVSCEEPVGRALFLELAAFAGLSVAGDLWDAWTERRGKLDLEEMALLFCYGSVAETSGWFSAWEQRLFAGERSLFKLSQYFFARDRATFFKLWREVADDYPPEFWVAYWSEQLWQAHMVVSSMQNRARPPATDRLPFSFLQRDWRRHTSRELVAAHMSLYNADFSIKNGIADGYAIELFVSKFVSGGFAGT